MDKTSNNDFAQEIEEVKPQIEEALKRIHKCRVEKTKELNLISLDLFNLPKQLFELDFLEELYLDNNPLENLDEDIACLKSLKFLSLEGFKFSQLPLNFIYLKDLENIRLINGPITTFPKELLRLDQLVEINLSRCKISELPQELEKLENLTTLWLFKNPIKTIDHLNNLIRKLKCISINSTEITNYDFFDYLENVNHISIGGKYLTEIPQKLYNLNSLSHIHISDAPIQIIQNEIEKLKNLDTLNIFDSDIISIPDTIGSLQKLEELWIVNSRLEILPASIGKLQNLKSLKLYGNNLQKIPSALGNLLQLEEIDLHSNALTSLPLEIGNLSQLKKLNLGSNKLIGLPAELSRLLKLQELKIYENDSLSSPPKHVIEKGTKAILSYLKDLIEEIKVWSSKLVIVGEGQVGKSCLLDALKDQPFVKGKPTTHALNLSQIIFEHPDKVCSMYLNVWDFGGQDIYHATHQFYLTNHSLFLLVWSARAGYEAGKIYKWLETISALAPDSTIFIVATNSSERGADLPKGDILNLYPNKVFFFEVDNESREGIAKLKESIRQAASGLKYMGIGRPKSWINSSLEIKNIAGYYVTKSHLFKVFHKNGVSNDSYESLASYLHDLGEILYYPDEDELNDTIIIKPEWVSLQIAKILDSEELSKNEGFLNKKLMQELWSDIDPALHDKLITLMEKFDLSYKTKDDKEISLIVEKLKFEEHENYSRIWNNFINSNEIVFKYQLDTIPAGIPTWFIARTHRFSIKIHWRFGVLLKDADGKHLGLLTVSPERKEIWLRVKGEMPYYFFAQLRDTLELTFNRFEGLKRPAFVPCPGHNGVSCKHLYELKQLEKRLSIIPPKHLIECPEELEDIDVMKLIFGLSFAPNNNILVEKIRNEVENIIKTQNQNQTQELIKFTQLEFVKSYQNAQEIADVTCPNIFTLKEIKSHQAGFEFTNKYLLQLYCQMPGCNHSIGDPYEILIPKDWILALGPYYNKMIKTLKYTLPLAVPGAKNILDDIELNDIKPYIDSVKEYNRVLPDYQNDFANLKEYTDSSEMNIRHIRKLLDVADPNQNWAGLKRLVSPEGHILWLCKQHYSEYKN